jgi:Sphingosine kinase and enzymes related to eukaryotic diacylglycerol kinase
MKILYVMNPTSGKVNAEEVISLIQDLSQEFDQEYVVHFTTGEDDNELLQKKVRSTLPDRVVACGGDGTVQLVGRNLMGMNLPMAILPTGSANGLATALAIPRNTGEALRIAMRSKNTIPLDVMHINEEYICMHLSDLGTNALLVKNYEEAGDKGMLGYAKHLISSIRQSDLMKFTITTPEETYDKEGYMLVIANAHKYGTGVQISEGSPSDGRFEICNVQTIDLASAIKAGLTAINIFLDKEMFSDVISCKEAVIAVTPKAHLQIDGEYMGEVGELKIKIISSALKVVLPDGEN